MRRWIVWRVVPLALALLGALAPATRAGAQGPIALGVGGGLAMPFGSFGNNVNAGWRALGTLAIGVPLVPVGVRLDAAYDHFGFERTPVGAASSATGAQSVVSGTVNVTLHLPASLPLLSPYAIGGAGPYRVTCSGVATCDAVTRTGWNAGVGIRFGVLVVHGFAEARFHYVAVPGGSLQYVPVTVGLLF